MKISLVVLTYNGWHYTHNLLMDIAQKCKDVYEVIVVDNGSEDISVSRGLEMWASLYQIPLRTLSLHTNCGFIGGMNYGISKALGDIVVAISNDVRILSDKFLNEIDEQFTNNPEILLGPTLYTTDTGWNRFGTTIVPYVEGYCIAATKKTWNSLGMFYGVYSPSDYEDVHLSMQMVSTGGSLVRMSPGMVQHFGGKTIGYNPERLARTHRNRKIFAEYWGLDCE